MEDYITLKDSNSTDFEQNAIANARNNDTLSSDEEFKAGTTLDLAASSEIYRDFQNTNPLEIDYIGTVQETQEGESDVLTRAENSGNVKLQIQPSNDDTGVFNEVSNKVLNDIVAIQENIDSGDDDIELPDTAAGGIIGNEGTSFINIARVGDETIAQAGYETIAQDNGLIITEQSATLTNSLQPTLTQSDENIGPEDQIVTGNVLDNDSDLDDVLTVQSYTVAGDLTIYLNGQTAIVEGGNLTINTDGSYSFTPANNWNGVLPVVTYTTNTNATETLVITITPVSDLTDADEIVSTNEDTAG